jgi:hypothetical protein
VAERPVFRAEVRLSRDDVFDIVARCDEIVGHADGIGEMSIAFAADSVGQFLLGRLMGDAGGLDS